MTCFRCKRELNECDGGCSWTWSIPDDELLELAKECVATIVEMEYGWGHHVTDARRNLRDYRREAKQRGLDKQFPVLPRR